jgi:tetratricopeptide (TPR) repeat protein
MRVLVRQRPEILLIASVLIFIIALVLRGTMRSAPVNVAVDTSGPAPAPVELSAKDTVAALQARLKSNPDDVNTYAQLGLALLQQVRETADPNLYNQAGQAFDEALKRDPQHVDALIGKGSLALSRHHFAEALKMGQQAQQLNRYRPAIYGIIGDAQNELGQYEAASNTVQTMVDMRPDLSSYSRASYVRELHGDTAGAIQAMRMAVQAGMPGTENALWTQYQLGNLYFNSGDLVQAEQTFDEALATRPDYIYALAGMARIRAAQGRTSEAIATYKTVVERLPLPQFVIELGELYESLGQTKDAQAQYDLVRAMEQLNESAGMNVDMEMALFDADHGADPAQTLNRARTAYAQRPSIYGADALAWALYQHGDYAEAQRYSTEALRLGTRDAALHFRAGMIANALGDHAAAKTQLHQALAINPSFSVRYAPQARALLAQLSAK